MRTREQAFRKRYCRITFVNDARLVNSVQPCRPVNDTRPAHIQQRSHHQNFRAHGKKLSLHRERARHQRPNVTDQGEAQSRIMPRSRRGTARSRGRRCGGGMSALRLRSYPASILPPIMRRCDSRKVRSCRGFSVPKVERLGRGRPSEPSPYPAGDVAPKNRKPGCDERCDVGQRTTKRETPLSAGTNQHTDKQKRPDEHIEERLRTPRRRQEGSQRSACDGQQGDRRGQQERIGPRRFPTPRVRNAAAGSADRRGRQAPQAVGRGAIATPRRKRPQRGKHTQRSGRWPRKTARQEIALRRQRGCGKIGGATKSAPRCDCSNPMIFFAAWTRAVNRKPGPSAKPSERRQLSSASVSTHAAVIGHRDPARR